MTVDYLIIGQGICGTMLSWFLRKEGKRFLVIDDGNEQTPSKVAAGIINPVTGRRYAYSWMIDDVMPFARITYEAMGAELGTHFIFQKDIIDFFPSPQAREVFAGKCQLNDTYLHAYPDQNHFNQYFHFDFGCGQIHPSFTVQVSLLLASWRKRLNADQALLEEKFHPGDLVLEESGVRYQDIKASKIIFCEGPSGMEQPWFGLLPFSLNKGEALVIECRDLPPNHIYKKGMLLAPMGVENTFWTGASYVWDFEDADPTEEFLKKTTAHLQSWLKVPFKVLLQKAAVRPATVERRPFVGLHPHLSSLGILNGMGSKGTSLAPYFANQLAQHLVHGLPISEEADVNRFSRILSK